MANKKSNQNDTNINPKDIKDLSKALGQALSTMKNLNKFAKEFNENICGAKDCLDEMNVKGNKKEKTGQNLAKQSEEEIKSLTLQLKEHDKINKLQEKKLKMSKDFKDTLKATFDTVLDIGGAAGFGSIINGVSNIAMAFKKGGPILGGAAVLMEFVSFIFNKLMEIDKAVEDISRGLGRGGEFSRKLAESAFDISIEYASYGVTLKDAVDAAVSLGKEFTNLSYVTKENQDIITLMSKQLGISSELSSKVLSTFMSMSGGSLQTAKNMASVAMQMAKSANLPLGAIMEDLAQNSEAAAKYGGKFAQSTMIASAAAKKMGLSFATVAKIAEGLLDIENSVSKQFEAQVLLGRNVNLEQARYYALIGDTNKLQREVLKQVGSQAELEKMMPLQRQALADAIGISVEELTKMVSRGKEALSVEERMYNLQEKSFKSQLEASEKMVGAIAQIEGALTNLGYAIMEVLFDTKISNSYDKYAKMGTNLADMINKVAKNLRSHTGGLYDFLKMIQGIVTFFTKFGSTLLIFGSILYGLKLLQFFKGLISSTGIFSNLFNKTMKSTAVDSINASKDISSNVGTFSKRMEMFLGSLGRGLREFFSNIISLGSDISKMLRNVLTDLSAGISNVAKNILTGLGEGFRSFFSKIISLGSDVSKMLRNVLTDLSAGVGNLINNVLTGLGNGLRSFFSNITSLGSDVAKMIKNVLTEVSSGVGKAIETLSSSMSKSLSSLGQGIGKFSQYALTGIGRGLQSLFISMSVGLAALGADPFALVALGLVIIAVVALAALVESYSHLAKAIADIIGNVAKLINTINELSKVNPDNIKKVLDSFVSVVESASINPAFINGINLFKSINDTFYNMNKYGSNDNLKKIMNDVSNIKIPESNVFSSFKNQLNNMVSDSGFLKARNILKEIGDSFYNISNFKNSEINIKTKMELENSSEFKKYHSESLKYLKTIALATSAIAQKQTNKSIYVSQNSDDGLLSYISQG